MKKIYIYGFMALAAIAMASCSDDDAEILEPTTDYNDNRFVVPDDATEPEAELRRDFYKTNGTNLVFSEVLEREYVGKDAFGEDVWKEHKIDFRYNLTAMYDDAPEFTEFEDIESKKAAVEFVEEYILPHINGSTLKPFSFLLVDALKKPKYGTYGNLVDGTYISCWRCTALAVGNIASMTEDEKSDYAVTLLKEIVDDKFDRFSKAMDAYYDAFEDLSYDYIVDYIDDWDRSDIGLIYDLGYLSYVESSRGPDRDYFVSSSNDYDEFYTAVMSRDKDEFCAEYGDYPVIITKFNVLRNCIIATGYKF